MTADLTLLLFHYDAAFLLTCTAANQAAMSLPAHDSVTSLPHPNPVLRCTLGPWVVAVSVRPPCRNKYRVKLQAFTFYFVCVHFSHSTDVTPPTTNKRASGVNLIAMNIPVPYGKIAQIFLSDSCPADRFSFTIRFLTPEALQSKSLA